MGKKIPISFLRKINKKQTGSTYSIYFLTFIILKITFEVLTEALNKLFT